MKMLLNTDPSLTTRKNAYSKRNKKILKNETDGPFDDATPEKTLPQNQVRRKTTIGFIRAK